MKNLAGYLDMFGWSQSELARQAGLSRRVVRRALSGEQISRGSAVSIAAALTARLQVDSPKVTVRVSSLGLLVPPLRRSGRVYPDAVESATQ